MKNKKIIIFMSVLVLSFCASLSFIVMKTLKNNDVTATIGKDTFFSIPDLKLPKEGDNDAEKNGRFKFDKKPDKTSSDVSCPDCSCTDSCPNSSGSDSSVPDSSVSDGEENVPNDNGEDKREKFFEYFSLKKQLSDSKRKEIKALIDKINEEYSQRQADILGAEYFSLLAQRKELDEQIESAIVNHSEELKSSAKAIMNKYEGEYENIIEEYFADSKAIDLVYKNRIKPGELIKVKDNGKILPAKTR